MKLNSEREKRFFSNFLHIELSLRKKMSYHCCNLFFLIFLFEHFL